MVVLVGPPSERVKIIVDQLTLEITGRTGQVGGIWHEAECGFEQ